MAVVAAAVFLVHPIQTEPALYIYQRSVLLACMFSLLALIALAERRVGWAVAAFFLAFESKESAVAVPLQLRCWPHQRDGSKSKPRIFVEQPRVTPTVRVGSVRHSGGRAGRVCIGVVVE